MEPHIPDVKVPVNSSGWQVEAGPLARIALDDGPTVRKACEGVTIERSDHRTPGDFRFEGTDTV